MFGARSLIRNGLLPRLTFKPVIKPSNISRIRFFHNSNQIKNQQKIPNSKTTSDPSPLDHLTREEIAQLRELHRAKDKAYKDATAINYSLALGIAFLGLSYAAVVLYRTLCARTGFGGRPVTDKSKVTSDRLIPVDMEKRIRVSFTSEVSDILPWKFVPQQREVNVLPGETALAFYKARNTGDHDIVGMATYSITPGEASPYFNKIQCFCFEEQRLAAGEEVDMPVFFFIDPDFANDPRMRNIDDLILHYAFFKAHYQHDGQIVPVDASKDIELTPISVQKL
ncbi:Cytochrome c oxidase assembly protein COX11,mitochondrial [Wickerhamomyces ciferrii]|uniref:Cytochrome c oxidase assembly protein COX11,mitochondrial n=1 Tax=Wickerhamomyces ciferrii (strain ATCC 14091 / BCRC 22168 / CBS 111 / JCM 3599 / NBRC 0793 / NRRL Y-1031 F-60-10) TaxID=1206466 RepID=K0KQ02_WICCF|nr:Cytochrome c oxidase assembly protein COX11,mitochondrial [Wickerhamomyces ciferrii]CCH44242.1 Cytochrome c oxidase assembly protein COX11,mitochondrial [Wickerhamomyces ciferrii]